MVYVYTHMQEYLECCVAALVGKVTACLLSGLLEIQSSAQSWDWPVGHGHDHSCITMHLVGDPVYFDLLSLDCELSDPRCGLVILSISIWGVDSEMPCISESTINGSLQW